MKTQNVTQLNCASLNVFDALSVNVESSFTTGLPSFSIVGLASTDIQESKDRIKSALLVNDFKFPPKKITINLSPSEISKKGSHFDLPIALLIATNNQAVNLSDFYIFGELGLDGALKDTKSIFPIVLSLAQQGLLKNVLIPKQSADKISTIPNINIYEANSLNDAIDFFTIKDKNQSKVKNKNFEHDHFNIDDEEYYFTKDYFLDFDDVKGQSVAKRAALISASGNHNIIFEGDPGSGKSMISKRMQYIMPPLTLSELLEKSKMQALNGKEPDFVPTRSFIAPHNSGSKASIIGGTKIGEIALAHNGILFFDELPHFNKTVLESLREPLEDNTISISRVNAKVTYETNFVFVAAMNPCPCGNLLSTRKECRCNQIEIKKYKNKLSDPFLDRIDLFVTMSEVQKTDVTDVSSKELHQKVIKAFTKQKRRKQQKLNGQLNNKEIQKFCNIDSSLQDLLDSAISRFNLSYRAINTVLKVSRTIADLDDKDEIQKAHLIEAISYRKRD